MKTRSFRIRALAVLTLGAGMLVAGVVTASTASAHAQIVSSDPPDGANLSSSPRTITLVMSEAVELRYTRMTVRDSAGHEMVLTGVRTGPPPPPGVADAIEVPAVPGAEVEPPVTVEADLPAALAPDLYRLAWSTLSSDDLHSTSGAVVFGVQRTVMTSSVSPADPLPSLPEVSLRWIGLLGMGLATGACALALLLVTGKGRRTTRASIVVPLRRRLLAVTAGGALATLVADPLKLLVQAHSTGTGWFTPAAQLLTGAYGLRWTGREAAVACVALIAARALSRLREIPAISSGADGAEDFDFGAPRSRGDVLALAAVLLLGFGYALGVTLTGHAGASAGTHPTRVLVETLHVFAALTWVGGLMAAVGALWGRGQALAAQNQPGHSSLGLARRALLARFGVVAAVCLSTMTVTGLLLTSSSVASADALIGSLYGRLLLIKLGLVAVAFSAAAVTVLAVHPALIPFSMRAKVPVIRLRRALVVEGAAAVVVLLLGASLASAQPAIGRVWAPPLTAQPLVSATVSGMVETVQVAPNRPGQNFVTLDVYDARRPAPAPVTGVQVTLTGPSGQNVSAVATSQGAGRWLVPTDGFVVPGRWDIDLQITRPGLPVLAHHYVWVVTDPLAVTRRPVISTAPLAPILNRMAAALAGFILLLVALYVFQARGKRIRMAAPPLADSAVDAEPLNVVQTAATSASPSPVPGSWPRG